jgi:hypothetical protein
MLMWLQLPRQEFHLLDYATLPSRNLELTLQVSLAVLVEAQWVLNPFSNGKWVRVLQ